MNSNLNVRLDGYFASVVKLLDPHVFYRRMESPLNDKQIQQQFEIVPIKNSDVDIESLCEINVKINNEIEKVLISWHKAKESMVSQIIGKLLNREPTVEDLKKVVFTYDARYDQDVRFTFEGIFIGTLHFNYPQYDTDVNLEERFTIRFTPSPTFM